MKFGCFGLNSRDVSAIDRMRDGLAMLERLRGNLRVSLFRAMIADACHAVGDAAAGLAEIDELTIALRCLSEFGCHAYVSSASNSQEPRRGGSVLSGRSALPRPKRQRHGNFAPLPASPATAYPSKLIEARDLYWCQLTAGSPKASTRSI